MNRCCALTGCMLIFNEISFKTMSLLACFDYSIQNGSDIAEESWARREASPTFGEVDTVIVGMMSI